MQGERMHQIKRIASIIRNECDPLMFKVRDRFQLSEEDIAELLSNPDIKEAIAYSNHKIKQQALDTALEAAKNGSVSGAKMLLELTEGKKPVGRPSKADKVLEEDLTQYVESFNDCLHLENYGDSETLTAFYKHAVNEV